jgi:hypothetical protein
MTANNLHSPVTFISLSPNNRNYHLIFSINICLRKGRYKVSEPHKTQIKLVCRIINVFHEDMEACYISGCGTRLLSVNKFLIKYPVFLKIGLMYFQWSQQQIRNIFFLFFSTPVLWRHHTEHLFMNVNVVQNIKLSYTSLS